MAAKKVASLRGQADHHLASRAMLPRGKSAIDGVFPHRQARARRAPGVDDVGIGSRLARNPFQQVEDQRIEIEFHGMLLIVSVQIRFSVTRRPSFGFGIGHTAQGET